MNAILMIAMLAVGSAGLALKLGCKVEEGMTLFCAGLVSVGYLLALVGLLPVSGVLILLGAALGGGYILYALVRKKRHWQDLVQMIGGLALFGAAALLLWWLCRGCTIADWDDFSHWGTALKLSFYSGHLYTHPTLSEAFKSYPPASTLWEYMVLKSSGGVFREDIALWAHALLSAMALIYPLKALSNRQILSKTALYGMLLAFVYFIYPRGIYMLGVDRLLGVWLCLVLLSEFLPGRTRATAWVQVLGCVVLTLFKSSGFGLALLAALAVLVYRLCGCVAAKKQGEKDAFRPLLIPAAMLGASLLAKFSWGVHLKLNQVPERWQSEGSLWQNLYQLFTGTGPEYRREIPGTFFKEIFTGKNYGAVIPFSFGMWFVILLVLGIAAVILAKREDRSRVIGGFVSAWVIGAVFVLSLLYTYLFMFSEGEARGLASLFRYLPTCCVAMMGVALSLLVTLVSNRQWSVRLLVSAALAVGLVLFGDVKGLQKDFVEAPIHAAQTNHDAYLFKRAALRIRSLGEEKPRLYLITANDAGIAQQRIWYELIPCQIPEDAAILMADGGKPDEPWVKKIGWQEWRRQLLEDYDYVFIHCPEPQFIKDYKPVFEDESQIMVDRMFKVEHTQEDAILRNLPEITADPLPAV